MNEALETSVIIPHQELSVPALLAIIKQYISRDGIDSSHVDLSFEDKIKQVKLSLDSGNALLVFDHKTQSCNILSKTDPGLKVALNNYFR